MKSNIPIPAPPQCGQHDCCPWHIAHKITGQGPYVYTKLGLPGHRTIIESDYVGIAEVAGETSEKCLGNAAFIVTACNAHDQLVGALRYCEAYFASSLANDAHAASALMYIRTALAQAQKEQQ